MERIAVISVALSVAVMLLAMAVIMGFKQEVSRKVAAFSGHAVVNGVRGVGTLDSDPVRRSARAEELIRTTEGFVSLAPYAVKGGIVRTADAVQGVMLKGLRLVVVRPVAGGGRAAPCGRFGAYERYTAVARHGRETDARRGRQGRNALRRDRRQAPARPFQGGGNLLVGNGRNGRRGDHDRPAQRAAAGGLGGRRDIGLRDFHLGLGRSRRFRPQARTGPALRRCRRHGEPRREQRDGALSQYFRLAEGP